MKKFACALILFPSAGVDLAYPAMPVPIGSKPSDNFSPNQILAKRDDLRAAAHDFIKAAPFLERTRWLFPTVDSSQKASQLIH